MDIGFVYLKKDSVSDRGLRKRLDYWEILYNQSRITWVIEDRYYFDSNINYNALAIL